MKLGLLAAEYVFETLPSNIDFRFEELQDAIQLEDKNIVTYTNGFRLQCVLDFTETFISATQLEQFRQIMNLATTTNGVLSFYLNETLYPNLRLNVRWKEGDNFKPLSGMDWGWWAGSLVLEGADILAAKPQIA